jgi:hypothetical protein
LRQNGIGKEQENGHAKWKRPHELSHRKNKDFRSHFDPRPSFKERFVLWQINPYTHESKFELTYSIRERGGQGRGFESHP